MTSDVFYYRLSIYVGGGRSCCVASPQWRKQVALDTIESLNATKLARLISMQVNSLNFVIFILVRFKFWSILVYSVYFRFLVNFEFLTIPWSSVTLILCSQVSSTST